MGLTNRLSVNKLSLASRRSFQRWLLPSLLEVSKSPNTRSLDSHPRVSYIGAALLILIGGIIALTIWLCRRRRNRGKKPSEPETVFVHDQDQNKPFMLTTLNTHSPYQPQYFHSSETPQTNSYQQYAPYMPYSDGKSTVTPDPNNGYGYGYYGSQQQEYMAPPDQHTQYNTGAQYAPPPGPPPRH